MAEDLDIDVVPTGAPDSTAIPAESDAPADARPPARATIQVDESTAALGISPADAILYEELIALSREYRLMELKIRTIRTQLAIPQDAANRIYWHCLRCGYDWRGQLARPPRQCARCHSSGWDTPPGEETHRGPRSPRTPADPPNPKWLERRLARGAKRKYVPTGRKRGRPRIHPRRGSLPAHPPATNINVESPIELPPLVLPPIGAAASLPSLPALPLAPLPPPVESRPLAARLAQFSDEPPQPESFHAAPPPLNFESPIVFDGTQLTVEELPDEPSPVQSINEPAYADVETYPPAETVDFTVVNNNQPEEPPDEPSHTQPNTLSLVPDASVGEQPPDDSPGPSDADNLSKFIRRDS